MTVSMPESRVPRPGLEMFDTLDAGSNGHLPRINRLMGRRAVESAIRW